MMFLLLQIASVFFPKKCSRIRIRICLCAEVTNHLEAKISLSIKYRKRMQTKNCKKHT